jgi:hypothetical protein
MPTVKSIDGELETVDTTQWYQLVRKIDILRLVDRDYCRIPTASTVGEFTASNV